MGRITKAIEDYHNRINKNVGCFYARDFNEIWQVSINEYDLMANSFFAAFVIGYRCGAREQKKKNKRK